MPGSIHKQPLLMPPYTDLKRALEAHGVVVADAATPYSLVRLATRLLERFEVQATKATPRAPSSAP